MKIDQQKLYWECRRVGMTELAEILGIEAATLSRKVKNPTKKLYVDEFLTICEAIKGEELTPADIERFLV